VVVDGRRPGVSEGMSARELTRFLQANFHPRYALNMDGGGSSTLCVTGEGDPDTHIVNQPAVRTGERKVTSHFCLVHEK
jgi:exopolysaccharide biosynthesis protein